MRRARDRRLRPVLTSAASSTLLLLCASTLSGCPQDDTDNPFDSAGGTVTPTTGTPTPSSADGTTTAGATDVADETGTTAAAEEDDGVLLDVGPADIGEGKQDFCNAVDILFVIDNSLSMNQHQTQLALAWPTFVDEMWANLPPGTDLHVGMTTTSFFDGNCSEGVFNCVTTASGTTVNNHYDPPTEGSNGVNGEQGRLFEWNGQRYFEAIVGEDSADLKLWFSQAAVAAGETGCSFEMMSAAAGYALHPANETFNAGFLRDEGAVLAIIVLTDEPDKSPEGAATYYDMVVDAKAGCGGDQCVLITGLVDQCIEGVNNGLWQFFNQFSNFNATGSIDEPADYANVVGSALAEVIGETCDQIPPAG